MVDTSLYPSIEYCKELKELGLFVKTEKSYIRAFSKNRPIYSEWESIIIDSDKKIYYEGDVDIFPCPSIGEMISVLPKKLHILDMEGVQDGIYFFMLYCLGTKYIASYQWKNGEDVFDYARKEEGTLPDALLKLCIWVNKHKDELSPIYFYPNNA